MFEIGERGSVDSVASFRRGVGLWKGQECFAIGVARLAVWDSPVRGRTTLRKTAVKPHARGIWPQTAPLRTSYHEEDQNLFYWHGACASSCRCVSVVPRRLVVVGVPVCQHVYHPSVVVAGDATDVSGVVG